MKFNSKWEEDVYAIFIKFLKSQKQKIQEGFDWEDIKLKTPFGTSLIDDPIFWKACKIERSFVTTLGQSVYEDIALTISKNLYGIAEKGFTYLSKIDKRVFKKINDIIEELDDGKRMPDWEKEIKLVNEVKDPEKVDLIDLKITMDLYIPEFKNNEPFYAEIKSPKPNKDQSLQTKQKLLKVYFSEDWKGDNVFFALTYNPYISRENYDHPHIKSTFKIPNSPKLLIGQEFWDLIGGKDSYSKIIDLAKKAGKDINILDTDNIKTKQKTIDDFN